MSTLQGARQAAHCCVGGPSVDLKRREKSASDRASCRVLLKSGGLHRFLQLAIKAWHLPRLLQGCLEMAKAILRTATFRPAEIETITGITPDELRDFRKRGYVEETEGWTAATLLQT